MRRFISYLALGIGALIVTGASFATTLTKGHQAYEFSSNNAYTFRLSDKDGGVLADDALKEVSDIFKDRLITSGVSNYNMETQGTDTIKVTFSASSENAYNYVKDYLCTNGSLAFGTENNVLAVGDEFKGKNNAYLTFSDVYPTVVLPINPDSAQFKSVLEDLQKIYQKNQTSEKDEEGNEKEKPTTYLYCIRDYADGDLITEVISEHADFDASKANNLMMQFVYSENGFFYNTEKTEIAVAINIGNSETGLYSATDLRNATALGNYFVNCLNASTLPCKVECLYNETVPAPYGSLINYGAVATPAWSGTLVATLICTVFICLILILFYRWSSLAITALTAASVFCGLALLIFFQAELSLAAIIGLILVAVASLGSGIIYQTKLREECYRGRSLRKSNKEANKRSTLPIVDMHIVLIVVGGLAFLFGGTPLIPFAAATVFGGLASLLLNTLGNKALMWLLTNTTFHDGKSTLIGVNQSKVPDILKEESQTYYGPYQDKNVIKHCKPATAISLIVGTACLVGTIVFGALNGGSLFNRPVNNKGGNVSFETTSKTLAYDIDDVENIIKNIKVSLDGGNTYTGKLTYSNLQKYERSTIEKDESDSNVEVKYTYITADIAEKYAPDTLTSYVNVETGVDLTNIPIEAIFDDIVIEEALDLNCRSAAYRPSEQLPSNLPNSPMILLGVGVSIVALSLYLALRYGLSRGAAICGVSIISTIIPVGFIALTRIVSIESLIFIAPFMAALSLTLAIIFVNKDKEMAKDDFVRSKDNSSTNRFEILKKSTSLAFAPALLLTLIVGYIALNFAGLSAYETLPLYLTMLGGCVVAIILASMVLMPLAHFIFKKLEASNISLHKPKKKKKVTPTNKSAEPEEAIFIGIND